MTTKQTILVIEDDRQLRKALITTLEDRSYNVINAEDGEAGLDMAISNLPDLIILDLLMPKLNGQELLKQLRKDNQAKHIPVVILTNDASKTSLKQASDSGAPAYFLKANTTLSEVMKIVRYHLGN